MSTPVLTALVPVFFFSAFFICVFFAISKCLRDVFESYIQNSKNTKYQSNKNKKQQQQEDKMQINNKSNMMMQNKTRQQAEK